MIDIVQEVMANGSSSAALAASRQDFALHSHTRAPQHGTRARARGTTILFTERKGILLERPLSQGKAKERVTEKGNSFDRLKGNVPF